MIGFLGFGVWSHHMFSVGMGPVADAAFSISTMLIAVPTGVKILNWIATLWGGRIHFATPLYFSLGFIAMFTLGGLSGVMHASPPVDLQQTDSYFIVAHFHYVLFGGSIFGLFSGIYYWWPKIFGKLLDERLGKTHFWLMMIGFNVTFFPMHFLGLIGMPRRIYTYAPDLGWNFWNMVSTMGVRRGLSLLRHGPTFVRARRHPRTRAVHAEHVHRRLDRRRGGGADRCSQRRRHADAQAHPHRVAARHRARGGVRQQNGSRRVGPGALRGYRAAGPGPHPPVADRGPAASSRSARCTATTSRSGSERAPFYAGPTLLEYLEEVDVQADRDLSRLRVPIQWVGRPRDGDSRFYAGRVVAGALQAGDEVVVLPAGVTTTVTDVDTLDPEAQEAVPPMSVTLRLADHLDVGRGDVLVSPGDQPPAARELDCTVCWMSEDPLHVGRRYALKHTSRTVRATVGVISERTDPETLERQIEPTSLEVNDIGNVTLRTSSPVVADPYTLDPRHRRVHPDRRGLKRHRQRRGDPGGPGRGGEPPASMAMSPGTRRRWTVTSGGWRSIIAARRCC